MGWGLGLNLAPELQFTNPWSKILEKCLKCRLNSTMHMLVVENTKIGGDNSSSICKLSANSAKPLFMLWNGAERPKGELIASLSSHSLTRKGKMPTHNLVRATSDHQLQ